MQQGQRASFACTALLGTNKAGILKPDKDGYYPLVLGALNVYNSAGQFYPYESAKQVFAESSSLMRRIANGACRGEYGHPRMTPGMTTRDFLSRVMDIYEPNVCCHIRKVTVDYSSVRDEKGRPVIALIGEVRPCGPMGPALKASLDNPSENVCFSVRSITNDCNVGGTIHKNIRSIVTWDYVNEPGISVAKKWQSPGLESYDEQQFMPAHLSMIRDMQHMRPSSVSMESAGGVSAESVIEDLGWDKGTEGIDIIVKNAPGSAKW